MLKKVVLIRKRHKKSLCRCGEGGFVIGKIITKRLSKSLIAKR